MQKQKEGGQTSGHKKPRGKGQSWVKKSYNAHSRVLFGKSCKNEGGVRGKGTAGMTKSASSDDSHFGGGTGGGLRTIPPQTPGPNYLETYQWEKGTPGGETRQRSPGPKRVQKSRGPERKKTQTQWPTGKEEGAKRVLGAIDTQAPGKDRGAKLVLTRRGTRKGLEKGGLDTQLSQGPRTRNTQSDTRMKKTFGRIGGKKDRSFGAIYYKGTGVEGRWRKGVMVWVVFRWGLAASSDPREKK